MVDFDIVKSMEHYYKYLKYRTNTISGTSPLTFKSNGRPLKNYRIYGNTVNGESVGDFVTEGEYTGKYCIPVRIYGKNLFDKSKPANILKCYLSVSNLVSSVNTRSVFIECKPNTTYTVSKIRGNRFVVGWSDKLPAPGVELQEKVINYNASSITITTGLAAKYLVAYVYNVEQDAPITADEMIASIQIEENQIATNFEPYHNPVSINLYISNPLRKNGNSEDYVDYKKSRINCYDGIVTDILLPKIPTLAGTNILSFQTTVQPSKVAINGKIKPIAN